MFRVLLISLCATLVFCNLLGGITEDDSMTEERKQELSNFAVNAINARRNSYFKSNVVEVGQVRKQIVNGVKYFLDIIIAETECKARPNSIDLSQCHYKDEGKKELCSVTLYEKSWENTGLELQDLTCKDLKPTKPYKTDFDAYCNKFNKTYTDKNVYEQKKAVYLKNMETAALMNEYEQGTATYGETIFSDLTPAEFKKDYTSGSMKPKFNPMMKEAEIPSGAVPDAFDWRDKGVVSEVKNQGSCGSCWAFSTTGNIEGQWAIKNKKLVSLSEQELVDCDKIDDGCQGGLPSNAYTAIMQIGGLEKEGDYPYRGRNEKCSFDKSEVKATISGAVNISSDEQEMAAWLYKNGPISIGINAFAMQFYLGGIAHPWRIFCSPYSLDHGVLIVGYGVKYGKPYWIIKNSWGRFWGVQGYYLVYRGKGVCGLNTMCTSAVI